MRERSRSYRESLLRRLEDNTEAANYLQAALEDSQSAFLVALKNVLDSRKVAAVARASKLNRVHIHQMLTEKGNPTLSSLEKILHAIGLRLEIGLDHPRYSKARRRSLAAKDRPRRAGLLAQERNSAGNGDAVRVGRKRLQTSITQSA